MRAGPTSDPINTILRLPDAIVLTVLGVVTALCELYLARVERASNLGYEPCLRLVLPRLAHRVACARTYRRLQGPCTSRAGHRDSLEAVGREIAGVLRILIVLSPYVLHGGGKGLTTPDRGHGQISYLDRIENEFLGI